MARQITIEFLGNARDFQQTASQVEGRTSKLGGKLKKLGPLAAAGFALAGAAAVKFGIDAVGSASDLNETLNKSQVIFGKQAPAMEKWASGAARSAGLSKQAALEAAAGFGDMFSQIGFAGKQAAAMSKDVVQMSADLGSFNNLPTEDVAQRIAAAFRGEYDSLQQVIPNINAARVESQALAMTGKKTADSLTAQEKAAAVLAIVHKDGARAMGDFQRTSGGLANQQKILTAQLDNVKAAIGQKLLPVAVELITFFNDKALPKLKEFGDWLETHFPPVFEKVRSIIKTALGQSKGDISENLAAIKDTFKSVVSIVKSIWRIFGKDLVRYAKTYFQAMKEVIGGTLKIIQGIFKVFSSLLKGDWKGVWKGIKEILSGALMVIKGLMRKVLNDLRLAWKVAWVAMKAIAKAAWDGIKALAQAGMQKLIDVVKSIPGRLRALAGSYKSVGAALIGALIDGLSHAGNFATGIAGNVWDAVRGMLNSAIDKINAALSFTIHLPGPDINVNAPDIPHLAKGGIVSRPTLALIGEDGPEAVVPLGAKNAPKGAMPGFGGGNVIVHIHGALDPVAVGRQLEQVLIKYTRVTGRPLQVRTS